MSQIASFTYLRESDIPCLGFWAKPKRRFLRHSEDKFVEYLRKHALRKAVFLASSGLYVGLVFTWFEMKGWWSACEEDPVIKAVRMHQEGAHWLFELRHMTK